MTDAALATPDDDALAEGDGAVASPDLWRIPGEATPGWVIGLLGLLGATLAVVAVDPWVADDPTLTPVAASTPTPTPAPPAAVEPSAPPAPIAPPAAPSAAPSAVTPSPAETPVAPPSAPIVAAPTPAAPTPAAPTPATPTGEPAAAPTETAPAAAPIPVAPPAPVVVAAPVVAAPPAAPVVAPPAPCLPVVGIPFARASARLEPGPWEAASEPLRRWLVDHPEAVLSVEGHADTSGTEDYNVVLSFARARATIAALARLGVAEARMAPRAAGTSQPRNSPLGITTNRLVVLQVEGVEICRDTGAARQP